ncbi:MAG: hypothetical protein OXI26_12410 [bacterium]|nr:hypothetical protein [bacterium]
MLWNPSRVPTAYYNTQTGSWSGFWMLDASGNRLVPGHFNVAQVEALLDLLF